MRTLNPKKLKISCRAPTSANDGISLQYFVTLIFDSFSSKLGLRFHRWFFFVRKGAF